VAARQARVDEELARAVACLLLLPLDLSRPEDRADDAAVQPAVHPDEHVLDRAHLREEADVLERAADAEGVIACGGRWTTSVPSNTIDPDVGL
jgi:hypothetical protein